MTILTFFSTSSSGFGTLNFSDFIIPCPSWSFLPVLVPSVGFQSIIVGGGFSVSRGMRLWETDLPRLLIFDDAFVWILSICKRSKKAIWAARRSLRQIICGFWSASSIQENNAAHHWLNPHCGGRDAVDCDGKSTFPLSSQDAKERPREWPIVKFGYKYNGNLVTLLKTTCNKFVFRLRHCANYWISWKWSRIDIKMYLLVDLFELFGNEMMRLWRLSIKLEFFNSLHALVRSIATLWWNWVKFLRLQITLGFPRHAWNVGVLWAHVFRSVTFCPFEAQVVFCEQFSFPSFFDNFYNAFFQRRLVHNDGSDSVCQNSFLRSGQENSVLCSGRQWIWWFTFLDFFVSVFTSASLALLSKQIVHSPIVEEMFVFLLYECVHPVHLPYVLFFLLPAQLL